jgi:hypothetical protein
MYSLNCSNIHPYSIDPMHQNGLEQASQCLKFKEEKMTRKNGVAAALSVLLSFGLAFTGCDIDEPEDGGGGGETWYTVTSLEQIDGTWQWADTETQTIEAFFQQNGLSETENLYGAIIVTQTREIIMTFDAGTGSASATWTIVFSGGNINVPEVWNDLKSLPGAEETTANDENHSLTKTITAPAAVDESMMADMLINSAGNKLKMPSYSMGEGSSAMIFTKLESPQP